MPRRLPAAARAVIALGALATAVPAPTVTAAPPAAVLAGDAEAPAPRYVDAGPTMLQITATLAGRVEANDAFVVAEDGGELDAGTHANLLARAGIAWNSYELAAPWIIAANLEVDAFSGLVTDRAAVAGPDGANVRDGVPNGADADTAVLRKANVAASYKGIITLRAGVDTSHWGLGLVANDGAHGWAPGSARFTDPRGGDRVLRGQVVLRVPSGGETIGVAIGGDKVLGDDVLLAGDSAWQAVIAAFYEREGLRAGLYSVARTQTTRDDRVLTVGVADVFADAEIDLGDGLVLNLGAEAAVVLGASELAGSAGSPKHDVLQAGAVLRAGLAKERFGGVVDLVYASGDEDLDDDVQGAFKADPNFSLGLVLFPYVVAAQSARSASAAVRPDLSGYAPEDLERLPTRGSVSNTVAVFPRLWVRPAPGLEVYGGALFAFADAAPVDPLNTRLAGGEPRNARDRVPGGYLGTELDLGVRYRMLAWGSAVDLGLEGGVLLVGDALEGGDAASSGDTVGALRAMLSWTL
ncbi:MAG: hypothetical protein H6745_05930 [Deltaproteobacteria bacterium]|nr:hypothetical protein [Deltaproteobacteria bacterium]